METKRLYYDNAYLTEFEAQVVALRPEGWAALDCSAFYPTSGGQPFDTGAIFWAGQEGPVTDVEVKDNVVWHKMSVLPPLGENVRGRIDWPRRFDHMQQHAADHMLAGAAFSMLGAVTLGLHTGAETASIDMRLPEGRTHLTGAEIDALETLVNARVQQDAPIRCWFPTPEELTRLPLRKQSTVPEHTRVVVMGDYEMVPCGGTHPASTGQIGPVKILSAAPARGVLRLTFVGGGRAVKYMQAAGRCAQTLCAALSADLSAAPEALTREREKAMEEKKALNAQLLDAALQFSCQNARHLADRPLYVRHLSFATPALLLQTAKALIRDPRAMALLSCPAGARQMLVFARGGALRGDMTTLLRACGAQGGGRPDFAQGSAADSSVLERALELLQGMEL